MESRKIQHKLNRFQRSLLVSQPSGLIPCSLSFLTQHIIAYKRTSGTQYGSRLHLGGTSVQPSCSVHSSLVVLMPLACVKLIFGQQRMRRGGICVVRVKGRKDDENEIFLAC